MIESLACGVPVIASDIGSLSSAISDGVDGLLHKPGDAVDLANKIERLTSDPSLQARLSKNCRLTALNKYSAQAHTSELTALFNRLLSQVDYRRSPGEVPSMQPEAAS